MLNKTILGGGGSQSKSPKTEKEEIKKISHKPIFAKVWQFGANFNVFQYSRVLLREHKDQFLLFLSLPLISPRFFYRIKAFICSLPVTSGHTLFMTFCQIWLLPTQWLPKEMNLPVAPVIYYSWHYLESFLFRQERPSVSINVRRES